MAKEDIATLREEINLTFLKAKQLLIDFLTEHNLQTVDFTTDFSGIEYDGEGFNEDEYYNNCIYVDAYGRYGSSPCAQLTTMTYHPDGSFFFEAYDEDTYECVDLDADLCLTILEWLYKRYEK
mgnify:CR=1 FL=1